MRRSLAAGETRLSRPGPLPPIVLFTNSPFMGGMEEHILVLARGLVDRGHAVATICSDRGAIEPLRQGLLDAGAHVHSVPERSGSRFGAAARVWRLASILRQYRGCVLHLHLTGHSGGELVLAAARLAGVRATVRTEHLPPMPPIGNGERRSVLLRDRWMDRVICVSEQTRLDHIRLLNREPRKLVAVANCVDVERFRPDVDGSGARRELGLKAEQPVIGTVSRLGEHRKGLNYFLDMAAAVAARYADAAFVIVGDGPLRGELEAQAAALGIADRVVFVGARADVPRLLAAMDIFVMPSLYEGGPITVLEAMAMAKPVVATPVGMVPDAITDGISGLLVPLADAPAMTTAVMRLLGDPALAASVGDCGRRVVAERFSPEAMVDGVAAVYAELTSRAA